MTLYSISDVLVFLICFFITGLLREDGTLVSVLLGVVGNFCPRCLDSAPRASVGCLGETDITVLTRIAINDEVTITTTGSERIRMDESDRFIEHGGSETPWAGAMVSLHAYRGLSGRSLSSPSLGKVVMIIVGINDHRRLRDRPECNSILGPYVCVYFFR